TRAFSKDYSNPQGDESLQEYLEQNNVVGISGIDTRKLVRHIRKKGAMNAIISSDELDEQKLVKLAKEWVSMEGLELASKVSRPEAQTVHSEGPYKIVAIDYGIKQSTINKFTERGCTLRIFPAEGNYIDEIKSWNPNGFLFSSGPGDPNATKEYAFKIINFAKQTDKPVFGIGMGHQLLALSEGVS